MILPVQQRKQGLGPHNNPPGPEALWCGVTEAAERLLAIANFAATVNGTLKAIAPATSLDHVFEDFTTERVGNEAEMAGFHIIRENLDCDRVEVMKRMTVSGGPADELGFSRLINND